MDPPFEIGFDMVKEKVKVETSPALFEFEVIFAYKGAGEYLKVKDCLAIRLFTSSQNSKF
jgi:hypothetical protein